MKINREILNDNVKWFAPGEYIFREGEPGGEMYIIIEGTVEIRKKTSAESSKTLIIFNKGDIFGEMAIIEKKNRSASALAKENTRLLVINENLFQSMINNNPDFAWKMIKILSDRLRRTNAVLQSVLANNVHNQIYTGLLQYADESGVSTFKGMRIKLDDFVGWACQHLGINQKEIKNSLQVFMAKGVLEQSALSNKDYIFRNIF